MNSSGMPRPKTDRREPLLVAEGGVRYHGVPKDPIAAWLDLMDTVEALASRGEVPRRAVGKDYRL